MEVDPLTGCCTTQRLYQTERENLYVGPGAVCGCCGLRGVRAAGRPEVLVFSPFGRCPDPDIETAVFRYHGWYERPSERGIVLKASMVVRE